MGSSITLLSGELFWGQKGEVISTVVGSCVAVCIFDAKKKIGGMVHYVLPEAPAGHTEEELSFKYGISAIPALLKAFKEAGSLPQNLQAKIVGGSTDPHLELGSGASAGTQNVEFARAWLEKFQIRIVAENVGGLGGRRVEFFCENGDLGYLVERPNLVAKKVKIRTMIVDDSQAVRKLLRKMLGADPEIEIVAEAASALEAEKIKKRIKPDVMTLDLHMPGQDGVSYLRQYMATDPVATIIVTDYNLKDTGPVMDALDSGAFDYVQKPAFSELNETAELLISKIKAAALVDTAKLVVQPRKNVIPHKSTSSKSAAPGLAENALIAIGSSTGGTEALKVVLTRLPKNIPPIFIVQHMPPVFTKSFAERLDQLCPFHVKEAEDGEKVQSETVYIAPGGIHMTVVGKGKDLKIRLVDDPPENRFKPSVDYLFRSICKISGINKKATILTGMGNDGAKELKNLKQQGVYTIAQDESTSVVFGMPKVAIEIGAVCEVLKLEDIAEHLMNGRAKKAA